MAISFQCPECGTRHEATQSLAGKRAQCKCGATVTVPCNQAVSGLGEAMSVTCHGCGEVHRVQPSIPGTHARCRCGAVLQIRETKDTGTSHIDHSLMSSMVDELSNEALNARPALQKPVSNRTDDEVLADYMMDESWRDPNWGPGHSQSDTGLPIFGTAEAIISMGMIGGFLVMAGGLLWFFISWFIGELDPTALIFVVMGFIGMLVGLWKHLDQ